VTALTTVDTQIARDRFGRPLIRQPDGKQTPYTRATTLAGAIDDLYGLMKWKVRTALIGVVDRPDLRLAVAAHRDNKQQLDEIGERALEAGQANYASTIGTALHSLTEKIDRGEPLGYVPEEYRADIAAYQATTADMTRVSIEEMVVLDDLKVAGTPDLVVKYKGKQYIADKKTGSVDFPLKMATQLAIYSRGRVYHPDGTRRVLQADEDRGIILHLAARTGQCIPYWIDLTVGWEAVQLALQVRDMRKRKHLLTPFEEIEIADAMKVLTEAGLVTAPADPILEAIYNASSYLELKQLFKANESTWTELHTAAAAERKKQLTPREGA
jgi:hypothetical protein